MVPVAEVDELDDADDGATAEGAATGEVVEVGDEQGVLRVDAVGE